MIISYPEKPKNGIPNIFVISRGSHLVCYLSKDHPGPIEVDFASLPDDSQSSFLVGLRNDFIVCDKSYKELHEIWSQNLLHIPNDVSEFARKKYLLQVETLYKYRYKIILSTVTRRKEIEFLRLCLITEQAGPNRPQIIKTIRRKIIKLHFWQKRQTERRLRVVIKKQKRRQDKTEHFSMINSDWDIILLDTNDLMKLIMGRPI